MQYLLVMHSKITHHSLQRVEDHDLFMGMCTFGGYCHGYFFSNIGDRIILILDLQIRRFYNCSLWYVIFAFFFFHCWRLVRVMAVCIFIMRRPVYCLNLWSNNRSLYKKRSRTICVIMTIIYARYLDPRWWWVVESTGTQPAGSFRVSFGVAPAGKSPPRSAAIRRHIGRKGRLKAVIVGEGERHGRLASLTLFCLQRNIPLWSTEI
jgi:hypothetical protein